MTLDAAYIESALAHLDAEGEPPPFWRHFHWGLFEDAATSDDSPEHYLLAAEALTERVVAAAGVGDGASVLDVGCGFGGTLDHLRLWKRGCALVGVNIDARQLTWGRRLLGVGPERIGFVAGDGCRLPLRSESFDHVLALECVFHFPTRKGFFAEAARVLRPGGVLALTDFLVAPGAMTTVAATLGVGDVGPGSWYGAAARPLTAIGYERLGRRTGFELLVDQDVTSRTMPTYSALRRMARVAGSTDGLSSIDGLETLARDGQLGYHVLAFRRTESGLAQASL